MTEGEEPGWVSPGAVPPQRPPAPPYAAQSPPYPPPPPYAAAPPPYPMAPPPYPMASPRTEELAVVALVLAFVSFVMPVVAGIGALVAAVIAARRIRRAPAGTLRGRGLVTAASIVTAVSLLFWMGMAALVVVGAVWGDGPAPDSPTVAGLPSGREVGVEVLRVGDCVDDATIKESREVDTVRVVPCWQPHDLEVYANQTVLGDAFPGDEKISSFADQSCAEGFERYVGAPPSTSEFDYFAYLPSEAGWENGDHVITCGVVDPAGGKLHGSARGAGTG